MSKLAYGMMTNPAKDIVREVRSAMGMGFDYVELGIETPEGHPDILMRKKEELLRELSGFSHKPIAHTPWFFDLYSDYEVVRGAWVDVARKSIDASAALGCRLMNIHAPIIRGMYAHSKRHMDHAVDTSIRSLGEISGYASGKGVTIILENMGPFGIPFKTFRHVLDRLPRLGVHMDISHAFCEGGMGMVSRYIRTFKGRIMHVHLSDTITPEDDHLAIGKGLIDFFSVFRLLRKAGYAGTASLEIHEGRRELIESLKIVRAIEEEVWPG